MATPYFGTTLTDLQSALTARDRMAAEQNIASQRNMLGFTQGMQQQAAQRAALQQQAAQQAAANQLAQEQMAQTGFFNRGRLLNEADRIRADRMLAERQMAEGGLERASREKIAGLAAGARDRTPEIAAQENELSTAANNLAGILNQRDSIQAELANLSAINTAKTARGNEFFTRESTAGREFQPQLSGYFAGEPINFGAMNYDQAFAGASERLNKQLQDLNMIVSAAQEGGAANLVTKSPTGKWVSNYRPTQGGARFFNSTPTVAPNAAITPPPAEDREVAKNAIVQRFRDGLIDRATAEQQLRALGYQ